MHHNKISKVSFESFPEAFVDFTTVLNFEEFSLYFIYQPQIQNEV